jgi:hypothetical protein
MGITIEKANNQLQEMIGAVHVQTGESVGPSEMRRIKEQDRLLEVLSNGKKARDG